MKDAYYFPHDSNAKDDPKCVMLLEQLGCEGYGIYWILVETLRDQPQYKYPLKLIPALARRYNTTTEKVRAVVSAYQLFEIENEEFFFSDSLIRRMKPLEEKRLQATAAGKASAEKRRLLNASSTTVGQALTDRSTSKVKKSRVEQSKEKKENDIISNAPEEKKSVLSEEVKKEWKEVLEISQQDNSAGHQANKRFIQKHKPRFVSPYIDYWNYNAHNWRLQKVQGNPEELTEYKKLFAEAFKNPLFDFLKIMETIRSNPYYRGEQENSAWKVSLLWILKNVEKAIAWG